MCHRGPDKDQPDEEESREWCYKGIENTTQTKAWQDEGRRWSESSDAGF